MKSKHSVGETLRLPLMLIVLSICVTFALPFASIKTSADNLKAVSEAKPSASRTLSLEQRVEYQRRIEEFYWRHRIWPAENPSPRPSLDDLMPPSALRAKVEDYLRKSAALASYWQRPITTEQLQAEINRIAAQTRQPDRLAGLFAALDNDAFVIAECLARPLLAEQLVRNWYAYDERFHGELRSEIEADLSAHGSASQMRQMSGSYTEIEWSKAKDTTDVNPQSANSLSLSLNSSEWNAALNHLTRMFNQENNPSLEQLPIGRLSKLQEEEDRFYVAAIVNKRKGRLKVARVEWEKRSLDSWWQSEGEQFGTEMNILSSNYSLPQISAAFACTGDTWANVGITTSERDRHTAVWTGTEMIVWGGRSGFGSNLVLAGGGGRYSPATNTWLPISTTNMPSLRRDHVAVWTGSVMIVWGGNDLPFNSANNGLNTGGQYNPSNDTWTATSTTNAPSARTSHTAVWTGTEMIVWGGLITVNNTTTYFGTGGRYNPSNDSWTATSTTNAPSERAFHKAVWTGSVMIVWGGTTASGDTNTGGRYNPSNDSWTATNTATAPGARHSHVAVWTNTEMIVASGWFGNSLGADVNTGGRYDPTSDTWVAISTSNAPSARNSTAVWTGSEMIVFGGEHIGIGHGSTFSNLPFRYNPTNDLWTIGSFTNAIAGRALHTAVWTGAEMIIFGGSSLVTDQYTLYDNGGRYNPTADSWVLVPGSTPSARYSHTAVWTGSEMIVWGGFINNFGSTNTGGRYDPATDRWTATRRDTAPGPVYRHTAVWTGSEMIVWGGITAGGMTRNDGGRYNPTSDTWTATSITNAPAARLNHTAVWTGTEMIVWAGSDDTNTGGKYNPTSDSWIPTSTVNAPAARNSHTAVWTGSLMVVWGGATGPTPLNTGGRYDPVSDSWNATTISNAPSARYYQTAVWTGTDMIVWGGEAGSTRLNTGGRYNPSTNFWAATSTTNAPSIRKLHTAVWTGSEMIVWGGVDTAYLNTGGRYTPSTDSWLATGLTNVPEGRAVHTAVWTGTEMIVWGGQSPTAPAVNTGGRYCVPASSNCTYSIAPTSQSFSASGGTGSITVTTQSGCGWTAATTFDWIHITSGASGTGSGTVAFSVDNNTGGQRIGMIVVAGQNFTVTQADFQSSCTFTITPTSNYLNPKGGTGSVSVTTQNGCNWMATSNAGFITITSGSSGTGNGTVAYSVAANTSSLRSGTITIAGQTFTVNQAQARRSGNIAPFDFDGDGKTDLSIWRPSNGTWFSLNSSNGATSVANWGINGDVIVPGDYDGDGVTDVAVWRPSNGTWYIQFAFGGNPQIRAFSWGINGDVPVPGDYDGDGITDIAIWRPSTGVWYIINSGDGSITARLWGESTDIPVVGDYDGDGKSDIAQWRPANGRWFIINSSNGSMRIDTWGIDGDKPVPGNYDGDGKTDLAIWRPSTGIWYIVNSSNGSVSTVLWGESTDKPVPGDYDGDGRTDIAQWRPANGRWFIISSSGSSFPITTWGVTGDVPVPSAFVR